MVRYTSSKWIKTPNTKEWFPQFILTHSLSTTWLKLLAMTTMNHWLNRNDFSKSRHFYPWILDRCWSPSAFPPDRVWAAEVGGKPVYRYNKHICVCRCVHVCTNYGDIPSLHVYKQKLNNGLKVTPLIIEKMIDGCTISTTVRAIHSQNFGIESDARRVPLWNFVDPKFGVFNVICSWN